MKNFINSLLRKTGYQISRFDTAPYVFRNKLKNFLDENVPRGKILDIGSAQWNYPKEHFKNVITLDLQPPLTLLEALWICRSTVKASTVLFA